MKKRALTLALALSLLTALPGCGAGCDGPGPVPPAAPTDLMATLEEIPGDRPEPRLPTGEEMARLDGFALDLLRESWDGEKNALLSPLSVLAALGMAANGAEGDTLAQMEDVLGMSTDDLNRAMAAFLAPVGDQFHAANSVWMREDEDLTVEEEFLRAARDWYGAEAYTAPFDPSTCLAINEWVRKGTDGMIPEILDEIPGDAMLYLVNALALDAKWAAPYEGHQIHDRPFTAQSGEKRTVEMMYGTEYSYLSDGKAEGFMKPYEGGRYAFAALLPEEGLELTDYLDGLTGEGLSAMLAGAEDCRVKTGLPKFKLDYGAELSESLEALGMTDAFVPGKADFDRMGRYGQDGLYLNRVIHKTSLTLDDQGTRAGAATAAVMAGEGAPMEKPKEVILDRPFLCMIVDTETNLPLFLGAVTDIGT